MKFVVVNFLDIKEKINKIKENMLTLRIEIVELSLICYSKPWLLEDFTFNERYSKMIDMANDSVYDIDDLETIFLNQANTSFSVVDLLDELYFITDNVLHEYNYYKYTKDLLTLLDNYSIQGDIITTFLEENEKRAVSYDEQIKVNRNEIKKLRKERRNYIEQN